MKVSFRAWVAGFFDGEGCITVGLHTKQNPSIHVKIGNTNKESLDIVAMNFGGVVRTHKPRENRRISYSWTCPYSLQETFLTSIQPFLIIKKKRSELALEFIRTRGRIGTSKLPLELKMRRQSLGVQIKSLNGGAI